MKSYTLIAVTNGNYEEQGTYSTLATALSRIRQLDEQSEYLERDEPTSYTLHVNEVRS